MYRLSSSYRKYITLYAVVLIVAFFLPAVDTPIYYHLYNVPMLLFCAMIIGWAYSVRVRILHPGVRACLIASAISMLVLFVIRICRYTYLGDILFLSRNLLYAYYLPMTLSPLLIFFASMQVGSAGVTGKQRNVMVAFCVIEFIICAVDMTNDLHRLVFNMPDLTEPGKYSHGVMYLVIVLWIVFLLIGSFVILMRKCRLSAVRGHWYIPAIVIVLGSIPLAIYFLNGNSSPMLNGYRLYRQHEAYCLINILCVEGFIGIGLIPSNTGYVTLYPASTISMRIESEGGKALPGSTSAGVAEDEDHRQMQAPISGGKVFWMEDISRINSLNREIRTVTASLEDENTMISRENKLRAEWADVETKRRMYDLITREVRGEVLSVTELLDEKEGQEKSLPDRLYRACAEGAFIKRMSNLMLIANTDGALSIRELGMSIRESFEYLTLSGHTCDLTEEVTDRCYPSALILFAYRLFRELTANTYDTTHAVVVALNGDEASFDMNILLDTEDVDFDADAFKDVLSSLGAALTVLREDETTSVHLSCREVAA